MLQIQSEIASNIEKGHYHGLVSLDLSAAFDMVNIDLLIARLKIRGLPDDVIGLLADWLLDRSAYIECGDSTSDFFPITDGTVQGSVLGPILFAIFIAPMFDNFEATSFADDSYIADYDENVNILAIKLGQKATNLALWFKASGLKVNESKTEFCVFHKNKKSKVSLSVCGTQVTQSESIKILGVIFDQNLNWSIHINDLIKKLKGINSIFYHLKCCFTIDECIKLATSIFYCKMYYCSSVWLIPSLNECLKKKLLSISALILKTILNRKCNQFDPISFLDIHKLAKRATPTMYMNYVTSINLYKICNFQSPLNIWIDLNLQHQNTQRFYTPRFTKNNIHKVGLNKFSNRVQGICKSFTSDVLSLPENHFKKLSKQLFLKFQ